MIELSRLRGNERYATCSDDVMAHWPYGSIQDRMYPSALCCAGGLPSGFLFQRAWSFIAGPLEQGKEEKLAPLVLGRQYLKTRYDAVDQLRFNPEPHIFIDVQVCIPVFVLQRLGGKNTDVLLIVSDHGGKSVLVPFTAARITGTGIGFTCPAIQISPSSDIRAIPSAW